MVPFFHTSQLKMTNQLHIRSNINNSHGITLALLDTSSAFDTIDHILLLNRFLSIGFRNTAHTGPTLTYTTKPPLFTLIHNVY